MLWVKLSGLTASFRFCSTFCSKQLKEGSLVGKYGGKASFDYDLIVIGGGSGGLAAAKLASKSFGAKVCLFDFVKPSTQGTTWGLGGTCVGAGCIPKKLMHYAGHIGSVILHESDSYGWKVNRNQEKNDHITVLSSDNSVDSAQNTFIWPKLVSTIQDYVRSLHFGYRKSLKGAGVDFINASASFKDKHTISYKLRDKTHEITGRHILLSIGCRPYIPKCIKNANELAITSDDIFYYNKDPGKVLVIGGSYVALECAGFLTEMGFPVTIAFRSTLLGKFDQQCVTKVVNVMKCLGTNFLEDEVTSLERLPDKKIKVVFKNSNEEIFDTVLLATGRRVDSCELNLEAAGVILSETGQILAERNRTNVSHIYAVGDCIEGSPQLTPVAIREAEYLVSNLFTGVNHQINYSLIPKTVFTPIEFSTCGLSEEDASKIYGEDKIEVFLKEFTPLQLLACHRGPMSVEKKFGSYDSVHLCLSKLVCLRNGSKVLGFHFVGPNAGEVVCGMEIALNLGASKNDFDKCLGVHPTDSESFTALNVTRASGLPWIDESGCGGGKCG